LGLALLQFVEMGKLGHTMPWADPETSVAQLEELFSLVLVV